MPATITPIDKTRGFAVKPAQGLRFGNFEGVVHLPPVKPSHGVLGPHSFSTLNNQQIYRTVKDWVLVWQSWQQKALLCSIVNRCSVPQMEILATTLEPLRHRDPLAASRRKPPPLIPITPTAKTTPSPCKPSSSTIPIKPFKEGGIQCPDDRMHEIPVAHTALTRKESDKKRDSEIQDGEAGYEGGIMEKRTRDLNIDQFASLVSSAVLVAALGEISLSDKLGNIMNMEMIINMESSKPCSQESKKSADFISTAKGDMNFTNSLPQTSTVSPTVNKDAESTGDKNTETLQESLTQSLGNGHPGLLPASNGKRTSQEPLPGNCQPGILRALSGQRADRSHNSSAQFLGNRISFTPQSRQSRRSDRQHSGSSRYRYSAFASSTASTPDFFLRDRIPVLGPMQRSMRTGQVHRPVGVGNVPVSLQQFYKHRSFWAGDLLPNDLQLQSAHKQELSSAFRQQLTAVYQWLSQWESHERLCLLKEVLKVCSADVLEALVIYLHQKLRASCDINRLPDKLLLYVLSNLPPPDILNAAQVCRRWRYLCAMDDLWIVKCLELGEEEGIDNMPQLIRGANTRQRGVDWMLAYMELRTLVTKVKETGALSTAPSTTVDETTSQVSTETFFKENPRPSMRENDGERDTTVDKASVMGSSVSEELSALMIVAKEDDGDDILKPELSREEYKQPSKEGHHNSQISKIKQGIKETLSEKSGPDGRSDRSVQESASHRSRPKEEEEEEVTALDIYTDLTQSKDLLGKVVPYMSLEWQTPAHGNDFARHPEYAGKVRALQRVRKVQGHIGGIQSLQFDRRRLITGGVDRVVRLWDIRSGRPIHKFHGHKGGVRCVKFDDDILVTGSWDSIIFVWDIRHFTQAAVLHGHENSVTCLQLNKNVVISGSHDHTVRVWSRPTYVCTLLLTGHAGPVLSIETDKQYVFSTATDLTIRMTDLFSGMCKRVFERANTSPFLCLARHGRLLLAGDGEGRVFFFNTTTGEAEAAVKVHDTSVNAIQYHNGRFYTGSSDGTMTEYDLVTMTCLRVLRGHNGPIRALQVSERRFVSGSDDGTVRIWDLKTDKTTSLSSVF